jgi:1-acyl-sn-glycerol-3-phosphate acyltransferase
LADRFSRLGELPREALDLLQRIRDLSLIDDLAQSTERGTQEAEVGYDPEFVTRMVELMELFGRWFDSEVRGTERLPEQGPVLLVGNHSGPNADPDSPAIMAAWYRKNGFAKPLVVLTYDAVFGIPRVKDFFRRLGQVPANAENAGAALDTGAAVLVYPGGTREIARPWIDRNRIDLCGRKGFIRLALRHGVPVIPVVSHGGHESSIVFTRGDVIAKRLRLDRIRLEELPVAWTLPWGIVVGPIPALLPLPVKVTVQVCEPLDWSQYGPEDAEDPEVLDRCYEEITSIMQLTLDELAAEIPVPLLNRILRLLPGRSRRADP